ncbi:flagellar hook-associated protein 3 FlgL [Nitrosospira sp. Nsp18]|uniref:flagellar hook-associated protein FlgL n=1 Tax=Nitrosospira sp. Nsp18 TaxID=1855334 RepID=UPI000883CE21|nr:flagellar hook-associated protein FlgL [Nitrosospira sp. Nsp18]SDA12011.1 flagellar hook-associated protein 3 FlgL [Nitrosospira sp. Nsp18]
MRVSSNISFEIGIAALNRQQAAQVKALQQISSGQRALTPSENPAAYVRALEVSQADSANMQYAINRQNAAASFGMLEATLGDVTNLLQNAQGLAVYAVNGTLTDSGRSAIATELRGNLDELLGLANRTDGNGQYLFSGFQGATKPFADTGSGIQYHGDEGLRMVQASSSRQLAVNESGREVFERIPADGGGYQSMFNTLSNLINLLETPVTDDASKAALANGLSTAQNNLSNALDNVLRVHASVGTRMKEVDTLNDSGNDLAIQYKQQLSDLREVDYAKVISDLTQQQTYLEATQKAFLKVQGLSLFDYIR